MFDLHRIEDIEATSVGQYILDANDALYDVGLRMGLCTFDV